MANNRMWLRCKHCHEAICLGKYYPISWTSIDTIGTKLDAFFEKHDGHSADAYTGNFIGTEAEFYDLVYESQDIRFVSQWPNPVVIEVDEH